MNKSQHNQQPEKDLNPLALQLFSIHNELHNDCGSTLKRIKDIGFDRVELAGFGNYGVGEFAKFIDNANLRVTSIHMPSVDENKNLDYFANLCRSMQKRFNCSRMIVFRDAISEVNGNKVDYEEDVQFATRINHLCQMLKEDSIEIGYHLYPEDFSKYPKHNNLLNSPVDYFYDEIKKNNFFFQLDGYWASHAFNHNKEKIADAVTGILDRVSSIHLSDSDAQGNSVKPGTGVFPLREFCQSISDRKEEIDWILEIDPRMPSSDGGLGAQISSGKSTWKILESFFTEHE